MDLNLKGKLWAGNLYHQFESICQDVDEFVSKDTVKFVENQVQSVGMTVKRFYSNVVQDILPLSGDIVKPESQLVDGEQVDMPDHVSVTGSRTSSTCIDEKQLFLNQGSMHSFKNSDASLPIEVDHRMQFSKPPYADPSPEAETFLHLREYGDAIIQNDEGSGVGEKITRDLIPVTTNSSFDNEIFSGTSDEDHKNSALTLASSPAFSAHEEGLTAIEKERRAFNHQKGNKGFLDGTECLSDVLSTGCLFESKLPMVEDPYSDENGSLSSPPVASAHKVNEDNSLLIDSPLPSACDVDDRALGKDRTLSDSYSTIDESLDVSTSVQSSERVLSYFSCNEEEEEIGIMPSTCCTSPKSSNMMESKSAEFSKKAENIFHSNSESDGCAYNISTPSSMSAADETKAVDVLPAFLVLESNDNNAFRVDMSELVVGSSESRHEQHYKDGHPKIAISPLETGNTYDFGLRIDDLDMETVDLSPDVKHDGKSVVLNSHFVHAAFHGRRNFRYYKKLIQDAFTSRKRLSKEYEHLAILYGDIDVEPSQHFEPSSVRSFPNTAAHAVKTESFPEMCETEWELL